MWNLTKNIFRVTPAAITGTANVHTVDEVIVSSSVSESG